MSMETKVGITLPEAKKGLGLPESGRGKEGLSPGGSSGNRCLASSISIYYFKPVTACGPLLCNPSKPM